MKSLVVNIQVFCLVQFLCLHATCIANQKIDDTGQFLPYPGVTVIAKIQPEAQIWKDLHEGLKNSELVRQFYSMLPFESYHMTTIDLFTKNRDTDGRLSSWRSFVSSRLEWFRELHQELISSSALPQVNISKIEVSGGALMLLLEMQVGLRNELDAVAKRFFLMPYTPDRLHVTLAYSHRPITPVELLRVKKEVQVLFNEVIRSHGRSFVFDSPQLSYFHDMTKFIPWDGESYPF